MNKFCNTLVHELVHAWQHVHGRPPKGNYHNKEWAAKMKQVGLYPSSTGMVGGKETGQHMSDYIIPNGPFARAYAKLAATGFKLNWQSAVRSTKTKVTASKMKFTCALCNQNAWGKPDLAIVCKPCRTDMRAAAPPIGPAPAPVPSPLSYDEKVHALAPDFSALTARAERMGHALEASWRSAGGTTVFDNSCERCGETFVVFWEDDGKPICVIEPCSPYVKPKRGRPKGSKNKPKRGRPKGSKTDRRRAREPSPQNRTGKRETARKLVQTTKDSLHSTQEEILWRRLPVFPISLHPRPFLGSRGRAT